MNPEDIELTTLKKLNLSDDTIDQIMRDIDVCTCEKCGVILSDDFTEHKICEECLYTYCLHCIHIMFGELSCICVDCANSVNSVNSVNGANIQITNATDTKTPLQIKNKN